MQDLIAKIGKGAKASKDLTWDEAKQAMRQLIEGQATSVQIGAFLLAMRVKMESVSELAAFTSAARAYKPPLRIATRKPLIDVSSYAGKKDTFHALVGSAVIAAARAQATSPRWSSPRDCRGRGSISTASARRFPCPTGRR